MRPSRLRATLSFAFPFLTALLAATHAEAQVTQVKPWFILVFDTSGSMDTAMAPNSCGYEATRNGAARCAVRNILNSVGDAEFGLMIFDQTGPTNTNGTCNSGSCGQAATTAELAETLTTGNTAALLNWVDNDFGDGEELCAGGYTPIGGALAATRNYLQGSYPGQSSPTAMDASIACRPVNVILLTDGAECCNSCSSGGCPGPEAEFGAGFGTCAIDCTDVPSCNGGDEHSETAPQRAHELFHSTVLPVPTSVEGDGTFAKSINTYAIGFGISPGDARIERIARAGHTDNPDPTYYGFYADNETALSAALTQIILESIKTEVCNGTDDDCDTRIDEGSPKYCDIDGLRTSNPAQANLSAFPCAGSDCTPIPGAPGLTACAQPEWTNSCSVACQAAEAGNSGECTVGSNTRGNLLCVSPGEQCDQSDDDCDGRVDEGAPPSGELDLCDLFDTDCDGLVDEDCTSDCGPEICNGEDDDCDGDTDEDLSRRCGTDVGDCVSGTQTCIDGEWGAVDPMNPGAGWQLNFCPDTGPGTETCNNEDDDCDGVVDRMTQPCSPYGTTLECLPGTETCINGVWQYSRNPGTGDDVPAQCIGARGPTAEICDNLNNDCDVGSPDGEDDSRVGVDCGESRGICVPGDTICQAGAIVCDDTSEAVNEICDGLDNDCDGAIDENTVGDPMPGAGDDCFPGMLPPFVVVGECELGQQVCVGGEFECQDFTGPSAEICDTLDNDCNASTPDGAEDPRVGQECGTDTGECEPGDTICVAAPLVPMDQWIECSGEDDGSDEVCDGIDNDCDFKTDEDTTDPGPCDPSGFGDEGACESGQEQCVQTGPDTYEVQCTGGAGPSPEVCDGEDNDCDSATDECTGLPGQPAYDTCAEGDIRGTDYGPLGAGGGDVCGSSIAPCQTGLTKCVPDTTDLGNTDYDNPGYVCVGNVEGMGEVCNFADDDCDTKVDEQLTDPWLGEECSEEPDGDPVTIPACREPAPDDEEPCGRCQFGLWGCVMGEQVCNGAVGQSQYESCNGNDDDCDGDVDECVDPEDASCADGEIDPNTPVGSECAAGACMSGVNRCVDGKLECEGSDTGGDEVCNNLDDDCDGSVDEGFNKGAPCTESGEPAVGECKPGTLVCDLDDGDTQCVGEKTGSKEVCNSLDDDCDRKVDEGTDVGEECGTDEGLCEPGTLVCVRGRTVCEGQVGPAPEVCDCADNDCDGEIDEGTGDDPVCGGGAECIMCQCALPCVKQEEFDRMCPQGKAAVDNEDGECFCVGELCNALECQGETIKNADDVVQCAPDNDQVGACMCKNNECTFRCKGVACAEGLACDPTDGKCKQATCLLSQFACEGGQRCGMEDGTWTCVEDTCADVTCDAGEACRDGDCVASCAKVTCPAGEKCVDGACETDECAGVQCLTNEVCDPEDGECVLAGECRASGCSDGEVCDPVGGECDEDPCLSTRCPFGERCDSTDGQCESRCFGSLLFCDEACVDPMSSREHCGASGDCMGANAGVACAEGLVCNAGACSDECQEGRVNCDGECIDPLIDLTHCGAKNDCDGADRGRLCVTGTTCVEGECAPIAGGGGGTGGGNAGTSGGATDGARVIASGGGGCACSVPGAQQTSSTSRGTLALGLMALLLLGLGRRRAANAATFVRRVAPLAVALLAASGGSGCKVDTFCLDCPIPGAGGSGAMEDAGDFFNVDGSMGGTGGSSGVGGSGGVGGGSADAGPDGGGGRDGGPACVEGAPELCNSFDDDCDGEVDEDALLTGIDTDTDVQNCGGCGNVCALPHAFNECVDGDCRIDRDQGDNGCDIGFIDLDGDPETGCEYQCTKIADDDSACNLLDDDCDGDADEDVDTQTDPLNCDGCNFACPHPNADDGAICEDGECSLDPTKCNTDADDNDDPDFADVDGESANGCEYPCPDEVNGPEQCDLVDNDCDGQVDEGVNPDPGEDSTDDDIGDACGNTPSGDPDEGECDAGEIVCDTGVEICQGFDGPELEVCDGLDNDCDGVEDTDIPDLGSPCYPPDEDNGPRVGSECRSGTLTLPAGGCSGGTVEDLVCTGFQGPVAEVCDGEDNDCDGDIDECAGARTSAAYLACDDGTPDDNDYGAGAPAVGRTQGGEACVNTMSGISYTRPSQWVEDVTICEMGVAQCSGGTTVCVGEVAPESIEQCDALDHDCDGNALNGYTFSMGIAATGPDPEIGDPCGTTDVGECTLGAYVCNQAMQALQCQFPMGAQTTPASEVCDGKDNDCDGCIDGTKTNPNATNCASVTPPVDIGDPCRFDLAGVMHYGPSESVLAPCETGTTVCAAGNIACPDFVGPTPERCDNIDQDCDGVLNEASYPTDERIGATCDTDGLTAGVCTSGTRFCTNTATPALACTTEVTPSPELCDGLDNDCDAQNDDGVAESWFGDPCSTNPDGSIDLTPSPAVGTCGLGTAQCLGGVQQCIGEVGAVLEDCDTTSLNQPYSAIHDEDCDGTMDEDFLLDINVNRCGTCSNDCIGDVPNANMTCTDGVCDVASCQPFYYDDKTTPEEDCSIEECDAPGADPGTCCDFGGIEICDGEDNDCDGIADESTAGEPIQLPDPAFFCLQLGACASSAAECRTHKVGDEDDLDCTGLGDPTCITEPVCTIRPEPETCNAPYNAETNLAYDEDCDGVSDSIEFSLSSTCTAAGAIGACATIGNFACDLTTMSATDTFCSNGSGQPVQPTAAGSEATANGCNNVDDDCDGPVDEACTLVTGSNPSCVTDNWVAITGTNNFVYAYEASRTDASSTGAGTSSLRACSMTNKRPWTNLTIEEAQAACAETHVDGRLCTEGEWQQACEAQVSSASICAWSFSANCTSFTGNEQTCNGLDHVAAGDDIQATGSTGSAGGNTCSRAFTGLGTIHDMSGNVKEYVDARGDGVLPVRGGAHNNASGGMRCDFDFTVWPDDDTAKFSNAGFRCCRGPTPWNCVDVDSPNAPVSDNSGSRDISQTITVTDSEISDITSVLVYVEGRNNNDIDDITLRLGKDAETPRVLYNFSPCSDNDDATYRLTFTDAASMAASFSGDCNGTLTGTFDPTDAFSVWNDTSADADWTLTVDASQDDETNILTTWRLRICGYE